MYTQSHISQDDHQGQLKLPTCFMSRNKSQYFSTAKTQYMTLNVP